MSVIYKYLMDHHFHLVFKMTLGGAHGLIPERGGDLWDYVIVQPKSKELEGTTASLQVPGVGGSPSSTSLLSQPPCTWHLTS